MLYEAFIYCSDFWREILHIGRTSFCLDRAAQAPSNPQLAFKVGEANS